MTDNEIIKALECCMSDNPPCTTCKYDGDTITVDECMGELMKDALDLINRQKANAEGLTNAVKYLNEQLSSARAEAVKEFAERLKFEKATGMNWFGKEHYSVKVEEIDNLVKEMAGASDG